MLVEKTIHGGLRVLGDIYGVNETLSGTLTVALTSTFNGKATINAELEVNDLVTINTTGETALLINGAAFSHLKVKLNSETSNGDTVLAFLKETITEWSIGNDATDGSFVLAHSTALNSSPYLKVSSGGVVTMQGPFSNVDFTLTPLTGLDLSYSGGASLFRFQPALFHMEIAGRILTFNGANSVLSWNLQLEVGQTIKSLWLAGDGTRNVRADSDGVLTVADFTMSDTYTDSAPANITINRAITSDGEFLYLDYENTAPGGFTHTYQVDLEGVETTGAAKRVTVFAKMDLAGSGTKITIQLRSGTNNNTIVSQTSIGSGTSVEYWAWELYYDGTLWYALNEYQTAAPVA